MNVTRFAGDAVIDSVSLTPVNGTLLSEVVTLTRAPLSEFKHRNAVQHCRTALVSILISSMGRFSRALAAGLSALIESRGAASAGQSAETPEAGAPEGQSDDGEEAGLSDTTKKTEIV